MKLEEKINIVENILKDKKVAIGFSGKLQLDFPVELILH